MAFVIKPIPSLTHPNLQLELHYDPGPSAPDTDFVITYNSRSRYILGTRALDGLEDSHVGDAVRSGKLIGMPVYAYVHGGVMLKAAEANPFTCQWDSGRSGWVYTEAHTLRTLYGVKRLTKRIKEQALKDMRAQVEEFSAYLNGDCYGFIVRDTLTGESLDSCWGYYGLDEVQTGGRCALAQMEALTPLQLELPLETATEKE
jgi:hypothetical protein